MEAVRAMAEQRETGKGTPNPFGDLGRKVEERVSSTVPLVEQEVRRVIAYLNEEVVPDIRREGSQALRAAAEQLHKLAQHLDANRHQPAPPTTPPPAEASANTSAATPEDGSRTK